MRFFIYFEARVHSQNFRFWCMYLDANQNCSHYYATQLANLPLSLKFSSHSCVLCTVIFIKLCFLYVSVVNFPISGINIFIIIIIIIISLITSRKSGFECLEECLISCLDFR